MMENLLSIAGIVISIALLIRLLSVKLPCPNCKQHAPITEKGYDYHSEHYCSNCGYKFDFTKG